MSRSTDVLIFVEDPGAANYVAQLPAALAERGWHTRLLADGSARDYLLQRQIRLEVVQQPRTADRILESESPRLLLVGTSENPNTVGLELITAARSLGIPSVGVVDAQPNADYRFRGRSDFALTYAPDWLLVPDEFTKETYVTLGFATDRVVVCGHPHYDQVRATAQRLAKQDRNSLRQSLFPGVPGNRPVIVFVTEVSTGLNPRQYQRSIEYTLIGRGTSTGRTEIVLEEFLDAVHLVTPRPYLVLRLHPKNTLDGFAPYLSEFNQVSKNESPLDLVYAADLVVGMTSMLLLEAALMGRPTLSIVPRPVEREWLQSTRIGITRCVITREELGSVLPDLLLNSLQLPPQTAGDKIVFGSLQRAVGFIERLLEMTPKHGRIV